jgi:transposase InsO family protein
MARASNHKAVVAKAMGVSPKHLCRESVLEEKDTHLKDQIQEVHRKHSSYGHRRVAWELGVNHKRTARVMKKFGIKPPRRKKLFYLTRSIYHHPYTNLIKDRLPERPNHIWVSDVSYVKYHGVFWYVATIEDVFTRRIMAVQVGKHHNQQLILKTLNQAFENTHQLPEYFHCDQGTEFMAKAVTDKVESKGIQISVSAKASPWENGYKESFYGRFKEEFGDINRFDSESELIEEIYSKVRYYNYERRHTALKVSPMTFAQSFA